MFEQTFKNIDDILHKDAGCTSELDYAEQSSWLLFLKYLDALEADRAAEAELEGRAYSFILAEPFRWERWAAPKNADGRLDDHSALTGDDLRDFVNGTLFPYLAGFKQRASGPNTIEYKIGEAFEYLSQKAATTDDLATLQTRTFYGREKKSLAYVIGVMNMILHGIEAPNIVHTNTLGENFNDIQARDRYEVILANRPSAARSARRSSRTSPSRRARRPSCSCSTSSRLCALAAARPSSSRTRFSRTPTTPAPACGACCWKAATCTPCWTARAAPSRARA
jgi:type I restriction enzyme M protein